MEVATGLVVPSYLKVSKMGPLGAQEGLETELMTKTVLVADTGPGRPVRLKWSSHWSSGAKLPITTKNGASRCPRRPRDGDDDEDGVGD